MHKTPLGSERYYNTENKAQEYIVFYILYHAFAFYGQHVAFKKDGYFRQGHTRYINFDLPHFIAMFQDRSLTWMNVSAL